MKARHLAYINIRHKLTGSWLHVHYVMLSGSISHATKNTSKYMKKVGSVASLTLAFIIIQYFIINKGARHFLYFPFFLSFFPASFNDFVLKFLLQSTDMHKIDHTFLFLSFLFFCKIIWRSRRRVALTCSEHYMSE